MRPINESSKGTPFDCIVIGGGPAGMFSAITAATSGHSVLIIEKNARPGVKLSITGKGRCNVTNNCSKETFFDNIARNEKFLYSAYSSFTCQDTMQFFESNGVALKVERGNRVFPESDKASDICNCLAQLCIKHNVSFFREPVRSVTKSEEGLFVIKTSHSYFYCTSCIIATGGLSYPRTGSTGDGYSLAKEFGHSIVKPTPSLVPLRSDDPACREMQGVSLKNVRLTLQKNDKILFSELGEMLFTHFGLSGPLVLSASAYLDQSDFCEYTLTLDFKPGLTFEQLDKRILRDFDSSNNKDLVNAIGKLLPKKCIIPVLNKANLNIHLKVNSLTKEERHSLVGVLKGFPLSIAGTSSIEEAIITRGGVSTKEISPATMQSKLVDNLYFAGEIIDVDAFTGGFNLQIALSTAHLAGQLKGSK